jgi:hypothetical protein
MNQYKTRLYHFYLRIFFILCFLFVRCIDRNGTKTDLGSGYQLFIESHNMDILDQENVLLIRSIQQYVNSDSILIVSKNLNHLNYTIVDSVDKSWQKRNPHDSMEFWIIKKNIGTLYGPLNRSEYFRLKNELEIGSDLKLTAE